MTIENPMFAGGAGGVGGLPKRPTFPGGRPRVTGGIGDTPDLRVATDLGVLGPEKPPLSAGSPAEAAAAQITPITAYHGSPYSFDAFKMEAIGTGEGAQSYGHGLYFAEHPEVSGEYAKKLADRVYNVDGKPLPDDQQSLGWSILKETRNEAGELSNEVVVTKEIADRAYKAHEERLGAGTDPDLKAEYDDLIGKKISAAEGQHYQVKLHADKSQFLDWDNYATKEQKLAIRKTVLEKYPDVNGLHAWVDEVLKSDYPMKGEEIYEAIGKRLDSKQAGSDVLKDAGIPGIKYLDQGSRNVQERPRNTPGGWQVDWNGPGDKTFAWKDYGGEKEAYAAAKAYADELRANPTHNLVVFDDKLVEITHRNGEPVNNPVPESRPALQSSTDLVKKSELSPVEQNPWQERFDEWVGKLQVPDDVKNLIRNASADNATFPEARAGQIPAEHLGKLSDITGIPVAELPENAMRQTMRNDAELRTAAQLMIKTNDDVFTAARDHSAQPTFESRKALVAAIMRRDLALEGVLGLRAEWGRTGNVMQEFLDSIKDAQGLGKFIKEKKGAGWDSAKLDEVAGQLNALPTREAQGKFITDMRKPTFIDRALWDWTNALLSGVLTHTKYVFANAAYLAHDTFIATPLAGVSGAIRRDTERVYMGETAAKAYGLIAGLPDAVIAAGTAIKTGVPTPVPAQMAGAGRVNPITGLQPVQGLLGLGTEKIFGQTAGQVVNEAVALPFRGISGIHSFFNFLGYRAELQAQGYRQAVKDGHSPLSRDFWQAASDHTKYPDDPMMDAAIAAGQKANFVQDLGPSGQSLQGFLYKTKIGRFVIPFMKVPGNIFNAVQEGTPFAFLDERMRGDLLGKNGGPAADMARGRLAGGSAVMATAAYWTMQDTITGNGPVDPKQRAEWLLTHQPNSVKIGDRWHSYNQFGPIGGWLALSSDLTDTAKAVQSALEDKRITATDEARYQKDLGEAYSRLVVGFTHWFEEAGFQGLFNIVEAMNDPSKTKEANAGATAATALPFSSAQSQAAAFMDPNMRETKTFVDGIKNRVPVLRETLPVLRDWSGAPRANPMYQSMIRNQQVNQDPVDLEMQRLDLKPTKPEDNIKGVKLTREQYDEYQDLAGINTRLSLHQLVNAPNWLTMPTNVRTKLIEGQIKASRAQAQAVMQSKYHDLINEATDDRVNNILGQKPVPKAYQRP